MVEERIVARRTVNALLDDVEPVPLSAAASRAVEWMRQRSGGHWVGGTATLTSTSLIFSANALNRDYVVGRVDFRIDLADVVDVAVVGGFGTRIIAISTRDRVFRIRCGSARRFAEVIAAQLPPP